MASEKYANNAQTTLNGSINNSTTTVVVTSATGFPTTGQFRILVDQEIMLVTSVSSNTFTVATRGTIESTSAASHADLATVTHILTKGAIDQVIADNCQRGGFASIPAVEKEGRLYIASDSPLGQRDSGSVWHGFGPIYTLYPPAPGIFSNTTSGAATISYSSVAPFTVTISGASVPTANHALVAIPGATPYEFQACFDFGYSGFNNEWNGGLAFYNTGTVKMTSIGMGFTNNVTQMRQLGWAAYSGPNAQDATWAAATFMQPWRWFKVRDDGTTFGFYVSPNGLEWALLSTQARATRIGTPTHVGAFIQNGHASNYPVTQRVLSWVQA